jgi:hypothetical protein
MLGQTLYMLGDKLSISTQNIIKNTLNERVFKPIRKTLAEIKNPSLPYHRWWIHEASNWNSVCWGGVVIATLTANDNSTERSIIVDAAVEHMEKYLESFTEEGISKEGVSYYNYGVASFIFLRQIIMEASSGAQDLFSIHNPEKVVKIASLSIEMPMTPISVAHFGDDKIQSNYNKGIQNYMQSAFNENKISDFEESYIWSLFMGNAVGYDLQVNQNNRFPAQHKGSFSSAKLRQYYNDSGMLVVRPNKNFTQKGLAATIKYLGGTFEIGGGHNHDDVGSYSISKNGALIAGEVGVQSYDGNSFKNEFRYTNDRCNSYGHPVPLINGNVQKRSWLLDTKPYVLRTDFTDNVDIIVYDMKPAYNDTSRSIKSLTRTFEYNRNGVQSVKVTDEVEFNVPTTFEVAMISVGKWNKLSESTGTFSHEFKLLDYKLPLETINVEILSDTKFTIKNEETLKNVDLEYRRVGINLGEIRKAKVSVKYT